MPSLPYSLGQERKPQDKYYVHGASNTADGLTRNVTESSLDPQSPPSDCMGDMGDMVLSENKKGLKFGWFIMIFPCKILQILQKRDINPSTKILYTRKYQEEQTSLYSGPLKEHSKCNTPHLVGQPDFTPPEQIFLR